MSKKEKNDDKKDINFLDNWEELNKVKKKDKKNKKDINFLDNWEELNDIKE